MGGLKMTIAELTRQLKAASKKVPQGDKTDVLCWLIGPEGGARLDIFQIGSVTTGQRQERCVAVVNLTEHG
jgi:hypothetical protein